MIGPIDLSPAAPSPFGRAPELSGGADFARTLAARTASASSPREAAKAQARQAAEEFVSIALVQPVLKQLRETSQAAAPFAPGAHEKQFGPLLDAELSNRITRASNFPLVDRLAQDLLKRMDHADAPMGGASGEVGHDG